MRGGEVGVGTKNKRNWNTKKMRNGCFYIISISITHDCTESCYYELNQEGLTTLDFNKLF